MPTDITSTIRDFVISNFLYGQGREVQDAASLMGEGIIDSTGVLQLVSFLEETYGITVADEEIIPDNLDSIENVTAYILRKSSNTTVKSASEVKAAGGGA